jgi:hypothetical protein
MDLASHDAHDIWLDLGAALGTIISLAVILTFLVRTFVMKPMDRHIKELTKNIQTGANGGNSLADAIAAIGRVDEKVERNSKENVEQHEEIRDAVGVLERRQIRIMDTVGDRDPDVRTRADDPPVRKPRRKRVTQNDTDQ